jgi:hypothetical protein
MLPLNFVRNSACSVGTCVVVDYNIAAFFGELQADELTWNPQS